MPRFVILEHDHPVLHWDLMLEAGEVLRTWRLAEPPVPRKSVAAEPTWDHRRVYLEYEGPISGDRGQVQRWEDGTFAWVCEEKNRLVVRLEGRRLQGLLHLFQVQDGTWKARFVSEASGGG
jgi:hypothetical protein